MKLRVIEGGRHKEADDDHYHFTKTLREMSTAQRRVLLARLRVMWPMHRRSPGQHAFLVGLAKWIREHA